MSCERTGAWRVTAIRWLVACACIGAASGCADFSRGAPAPGPADGAADAAADDADAATSDAASALSFAADVHPLLVPTCQRCHAPGEAAGESGLLLSGDAPADYAAVAKFVDTPSPGASRILAKMSGSGHSGGAVYAVGSPEYRTVLRWIEQGAKP